MSRRIPALIAILAATAGAAALPAGASAVPKAQLVGAELVQCKPDPDQSKRVAVFRGTIRSIKGAAGLGIRFDLERRAARGRFEALAAPGLGVWNRSSARVARYRFKQRIQNLDAPGGYRAVVSFRWYDAKGRALKTVKARSGACTMPDYRPDLRVEAIRSAGPRMMQEAGYAVVVRNAGRGLAPDFDVLLRSDGVGQPLQHVGLLRPGERTTLFFAASACRAGGAVEAVADPDGRLPEVDEGNNAGSVACAAARRRT